MPVFYVVFLLLAALVAWLSYFFLRRAVRAFGVDTKRRRNKLLLWGGATAIGICSLVLQSFFVPFLLHFFMFAALFQIGNFIFRKIARKHYENGFSVWKKIYALSLLPILLTAVALVYGYVNLHTVVATHYTVQTEKDIREEGYRAVFLSDVHYGVSLDREELQAVCDEITAQKPDFVILGGDIVDHETGKEKTREAFEIFGTVESTYGTFFVFGNHDRPMRGMPSEFADQYGEEELIALIEACGIRVLQETIADVGENYEIALMGREDRSVPERDSVLGFTSSTFVDVFRLMIDHQPCDYRENGDHGTDLVLSGHTHGGQFFPLNYLMTFFGNDAVYGRTDIDENTVAIVSSGLACWGYPYKTAAPAEYLVIDIVPTK